MMTSTPSPKSPEISEKSKKYDRQLRLWGDHGQHKLEKSHICLINANAVGTEILKSLILPGCGRITVVDGHKVSQEDVGSNFFLEAENIGKNRGSCAISLLLDLNPDAFGEAIEDNLETILKQNPTFFNHFSCVIGSQLTERVLVTLSETLWDNDIPFVYVHTVGLIGWIRIQVKEHCVVETHPDESSIQDLRLDAPFQELIKFMKDVDVKDRSDALKTPWLTLLYKAIEKFLTENNSAPVNGQCNDRNSLHPCTFKGQMKQKFKCYYTEYLKQLDLTEADETFEEAIKALNTALNPTVIPSEVKLIMDDEKVSKLAPTKFWILCSALKEFCNENQNKLPLPGIIPDMTADSERYIALQNIYREKATKDADDILEKAQNILRHKNIQNLSIHVEDARIFCKESAHLRLARGTSLATELKGSPKSILQEITYNMEDCDSEVIYYIMLRGLLRFQEEYGVPPGSFKHDVESDITRLKGILTRLFNEWNSSLSAKEDYIHEVVRYGGSEIPSVAAFVGGCAAQEVIKLVTCQFVPLHETFIYNAMSSTTRSFKIE